MKFCIDSMYGAGGTILSDIFTRLGVANVPIRSNPDPLFPGINPEPIEPHIRALGEAVVANGCQAGLCTDGDADRIGATDEHGNFVDPHKIYSVLLSWVLRRKGWPGAVTRAFNTTKMLDRICAKHRPRADRARHRLQVCLRLHAGARDCDGRRGVGRHRLPAPPAGARRPAECAAAGQRDGRRGQDAGPTGGRSAGRVRRASVRPHRPAHPRRREERRHCPRPRAASRRLRVCRNAHPAPGRPWTA